MSEQDRTRLYAWLREQAGESEAEYLMSCLPPAPLPDLVTKDYFDASLDAKLDAKLSKFVTKDYLDSVLDAKLGAELSSVNARIDRLAEQQAEDRRANQVRHYWLAGIGLSAAVPIWLSAVGVIA